MITAVTAYKNNKYAYKPYNKIAGVQGHPMINKFGIVLINE